MCMLSVVLGGYLLDKYRKRIDQDSFVSTVRCTPDKYSPGESIPAIAHAVGIEMF